MFYLIEKNTKTIAGSFNRIPDRLRIPDSGDVVFNATAPMDIGPDHLLRETTVIGFEPFDPDTQVRTGPVNTVAPDFSSTATYTIRAKSQAELDADQRGKDLGQLREAGKDLALVLTELIDWTLANTPMQATDFTPDVRQAYLDLKTIANRVKA